MKTVKKRSTFYHHSVHTEFGLVFIVTDHMVNDQEEERILLELATHLATSENLNNGGNENVCSDNRRIGFESASERA